MVSSIWSINGTLIGITTLGQSGPGSNGNEWVLHIPQSSKTGASPSNGLVSHQDTHGGGVLLLSRDAVSVF